MHYLSTDKILQAACKIENDASSRLLVGTLGKSLEFIGFKIGAQEFGVEEPHQNIQTTSAFNLFRLETILQVEFDVVAESKSLSPQNLRDLVRLHGGAGAAGRAIGASEAFVRQNAKL